MAGRSYDGKARIAFSNAYMFNKVMLDERICAAFLERVLDLQVESIDYKNAEQVLEPAPDSKGVRLDLFARTSDGAFDIEMQSDPKGALGRRFRYYQSAIDVELLDKGADYWELPESYVIFICRFDPFGCGLPIYRLERACAEGEAVDVQCGSHWVALNCEAYADAPSDGMRALLEYVQSGTVDRRDALVSAIDSAVDKANDDRKWVGKMFSVSTIEEDRERQIRYEIWKAAQDGEERGRAEGIAEGRADAEARYSALVDKLLDAGRLDDLKRASSDDAFREKLYAEFKL